MAFRARGSGAGYTLVELVISMTVLAFVALGVLSLFTTLANSAAVTKRKAIASSLATNQMEFLRSLPYDSLAIAGSNIYSANPLPATTTKNLNGVTYTIVTSISYVDDAYDGCGAYPTLVIKQTYCRNYPPPAAAPSTDSNPEDYKIAHVSVYAPSSNLLAEVDSEISARVSETSSNTGALFVKVIDNNGNPVSGASVQVLNGTVTPNVNQNDSTDSNGISIFYGLPPDTHGYDYNVTATKSGYSSLTTIPPFGSLQPNYSNQQIIAQQSAFVTLVIMPQGPNSLVVEATDLAGNPIGNLKVYVKGGYKKYTSTNNTTYYYDNMSPTDTRPTTDAGGLAAVSNLVPGNYIFCGDAGGTGCGVGSTNYYLSAAIPYSGSNPFYPVTVPTYDPASPPTTTFAYNGTNYYQKVRLLFSTSPSSPTIQSITPYEASLTSGANNFGFQIIGTNLPCGQSSCNTSVKFAQGSNIYTASCTGNGSSTMNCTIDLSAATVGSTQLILSNSGGTLTVPASLTLGGILVTQ